MRLVPVPHVFAPPPCVDLPVAGSDARLPVRRVFCVGRNYAEHAKEMGFTGREPPFFFMKPAEALLVDEGTGVAMAYPTLTSELHHEIELVAVIGSGGAQIPVEAALSHVYGYAVGLDMTRRDLQAAMKKEGRPWEIGKAFDQSAPIAAVMPASAVPEIATAAITLAVNGVARQQSRIDRMIWSVAETVAHLSAAWTLLPGDLIFTGTPEGVGAVARGDALDARIDGLPPLSVTIA